MTDKPTKEALMKAQEAWDQATNAYSRYPGTENWRAFLECKAKVLRLKELLEPPAPPIPVPVDPSTPLSTSERIHALLHNRKELSSSEMWQNLGITKDQLRHGLLKLLKEGKIEKVKTGFYRVK
jgi:predicted Rossmann fold nucleotide-binding protein DprA/Smf involved in DNA uptake